MWCTGINAHLEAATVSWLPEGAKPLTLPDSIREALETVTDPSTKNLRTLGVAMSIINSLLVTVSEIGLMAGFHEPALGGVIAVDFLWAGGEGSEDTYNALHRVAEVDRVNVVVVRALQNLASTITAVTNWDDNSPDGTHMWSLAVSMAMTLRAHHEQLGDDAAYEAAVDRLVRVIKL